MAEIKIQKKRNPIWPWLIGIIVIGVIIWIFFTYVDFTKKGSDIAIITDSVAVQDQDLKDSTVNDKINDFTSFVNNNTAANNTVEYSKEALHKLSAALGAIIDRDDTLQANLQVKQDTLRDKIDKISSYTDTSGTVEIKNALLASAELIKSIQQEKYQASENQAYQAQSAAESIDSYQPIKKQEGKIKNFFNSASMALANMKERNTTMNNITD